MTARCSRRGAVTAVPTARRGPRGAIVYGDMLHPPLRRAAVAAIALSLGALACRQPNETGDAALADAATELRAAYAAPPAAWPAADLDERLPGDPPSLELGPVPPVAHPERNPHTQEKEDLGRLLFFDGRLSGTGQMACASCHAPELGWADGRATAMGHGALPGGRNTPSILNSGHLDRLFWDGRAADLEDLVRQVFANPTEMRIDEGEMLRGLASSAGYAERFEAVFGDPEPTLDRVVDAIACFCRSVNSEGRSDFDRFLAGEGDALSDEALRGLHLFRTKARCMNCHDGPLVGGRGFHDLGLSYYGRELEDLGRYGVTGAAADVGRFRTPSLRNVSRTAPYMHNGLFPLTGVLNMYSNGMPTLRRKPEQEGDPLFPTKSPHLAAVGLTAREKADLTAFLDSLTERRRRVRVDLPAFGDREE